MLNRHFLKAVRASFIILIIASTIITGIWYRNKIDLNFINILSSRCDSIAEHLQKHLGDCQHLRIVEIGHSKGALCARLAYLGWTSYTIISDNNSTEQVEKYLVEHGMQNIQFMDDDSINSEIHCDLVVCANLKKLPTQKKKKSIYSIIKNAPYGIIYVGNIAHPEKMLSILNRRDRKCGIHKKFLYWFPSAVEGKKPISCGDNPNLKESIVTYSLSGGRLGDNLIAYFHAKWIAFKYHIPFSYIPFQFSDAFHLESDRFDDVMQTINVTDENEIQNVDKPTRFVVPYFPESPFEFGHEVIKPFEVDWNNSDFQFEIAKCLTPKHPVNTIELPQNRITVAVHVRRGKKQRGGADGRKARQAFPLKFPPDQFYIEEIRRVTEIFKNVPLYVFIFTDYPYPKRLAKRYRNLFAHKDIEFGYRESDNASEKSQFEDFFAMTQFDCLIYCHSNFSVMASKLGKYIYTSLPMHCFSKGNFVAIDEVDLTFDGSILNTRLVFKRLR